MEHENVDENAEYLMACENVKKIVNAIKNIRIKYYTNFARISAEDKQKYELLEANLEKISETNDLGRLKNALMEEVSDKYGREKSPKGPNIDKRLSACYGAVDVQQKALASGKIGKAIKCQKILQEYLDEIDNMSYREIVINYKRKKFEELIRSKDDIEERKETWRKDMKGFCKSEDIVEREEVAKIVNEKRLELVTLFTRVADQKVQKVDDDRNKNLEEVSIE